MFDKDQKPAKIDEEGKNWLLSLIKEDTGQTYFAPEFEFEQESLALASALDATFESLVLYCTRKYSQFETRLVVDIPSMQKCSKYNLTSSQAHTLRRACFTEHAFEIVYADHVDELERIQELCSYSYKNMDVDKLKRIKGFIDNLRSF